MRSLAMSERQPLALGGGLADSPASIKVHPHYGRCSSHFLSAGRSSDTHPARSLNTEVLLLPFYAPSFTRGPHIALDTMRQTLTTATFLSSAAALAFAHAPLPTRLLKRSEPRSEFTSVCNEISNAVSSASAVNFPGEWLIFTICPGYGSGGVQVAALSVISEFSVHCPCKHYSEV